MDRIKPYLESAEKNIRAKKFKEALDDAEMALLFMGKQSIFFKINLFRHKLSSKFVWRYYILFSELSEILQKLIGRCCIELKNYDKAEGYVKQALDSQPENLDCLKVMQNILDNYLRLNRHYVCYTSR